MQASKQKLRLRIFSILCLLLGILAVTQTIWDIFFVGGFIQNLLFELLLLIMIGMIPITVIYGFYKRELSRFARVFPIGAIFLAILLVWSVHVLDKHLHLKFRLRYHSYQEVVDKIESGELAPELDAPFAFHVDLPAEYPFLTSWDSVYVTKEFENSPSARAYFFKEIESLLGDGYTAFVYQPAGSSNERCWLRFEAIGPKYPGWYFCDSPG